MNRSLAALVISLIVALGLAPGAALAATGGNLAAAEAGSASTALAPQTLYPPEIAVKRAATGKVALKAGKSYKLGAKPTVGWLAYKSSNKKVAKVSYNGVVKAKKPGKAKITIVTRGAYMKAVKKITVKVLPARKYKAVRKVKAKASATSLTVGMTGKVKAAFTPSKASNRNVIYKSSNPQVLTVSASGNIRAVKPGTATVTVTSCANARAKSRVTITVKASSSYQPLNRSKWEARMHLPADSQIRGYSAYNRSPYIVCWPEFPGTNGFTQYAVDFKADSQPCGTYVSIGNWFMDMSSLRARYASVSADPGASPGLGYAGFQVLADGSKVAIMSTWKIYVTNSSGKTSAINAKRIYPENPRVGGSFGGEGTGVQTIVDYDWKAGRTYRALIQCGRTSAGNCTLEFWVLDLQANIWTKLVVYDLGYGNTYMTGVGCFLENYLVEHAAEIRTVEWSNFRADSREAGTWVSAKSAIMERQFNDWSGSYNYGSDATCFWAVTTGIPNLCRPPANQKRFYVSSAATGSPF